MHQLMRHGRVLITLLLTALSGVASAHRNTVLFYDDHTGVERWDWEHIDTSQIHFSRFLWGTATASVQNEGTGRCPSSIWHPSVWKNAADGSTSETTCDLDLTYEQDIKLIKQLGNNSFRFSIEWGRIEPEPGLINYDELERYRDMCIKLRDNGIVPMVTLHHFSHPIWFEEMGGFSDGGNIDYFVRYAQRVFDHLYDVVPLWCTFNEPGVFAHMGYLLGMHPPGKHWHIGESVQVLKNMLRAHVATYRILKAQAHIHGSDNQIGIVHNILRMVPYYRYDLVVNRLCALFTTVTHDLIMEFLRSGNFHRVSKRSSRLTDDVTYADPMAPQSYDFFGLNFYAKVLLGMSKTGYRSSGLPGDIETDMQLPFDPEGFYYALCEASSLGAPVYVTENGLADAADDRRELFFQRYLYAMSRAIEDGCDVRGYYAWTLMDNWEWSFGWNLRFGLFAYDPVSGAKTLRDGSRYYQQVCRKFGS